MMIMKRSESSGLFFALGSKKKAMTIVTALQSFAHEWLIMQSEADLRVEILQDDRKASGSNTATSI